MENNGCLQFIQNPDGSIPMIKSSRTYPGIKMPDEYCRASRIDESDIDESKIINDVGKKGSYSIFNPNLMHRATCPEEE